MFEQSSPLSWILSIHHTALLKETEGKEARVSWPEEDPGAVQSHPHHGIPLEKKGLIRRTTIPTGRYLKKASEVQKAMVGAITPQGSEQQPQPT